MTNSNRRGSVVAENPGGSLEHVGGRSYVGSATVGGKVVTKRFRRGDEDEADVVRRWEKWQGRKEDGEEAEEMAENDVKERTCPLSCQECAPSCPMWSAANGACAIMLGGVALYNMSANFGRLDMTEPLELLAMAVADSGAREDARKAPTMEAAKTEAQGMDAYLDGKAFVKFVNLSSKRVHADYAAFCKDGGYPQYGEHDMMQAIASRFSELRVKGVRGGSVFEAA
jgi:hypothetical protein